jgi:hypothetical protein
MAKRARRARSETGPRREKSAPRRPVDRRGGATARGTIAVVAEKIVVVLPSRTPPRRSGAHRRGDGPPVARVDDEATAHLARGVDVTPTLRVEGRTHGACIAPPNRPRPNH